jgi:hypothetical protein
MLSVLHKNKLIKFVKLVTDLLSQLEELYVEDIETKKLALLLPQKGKKLLTYFQQEILTLTDDEWESSFCSSWQSFQTETHRCLRLLNTDLLFFASSTNQQTRQQRILQIKNRLETIRSYCHFE